MAPTTNRGLFWKDDLISDHTTTLPKNLSKKTQGSPVPNCYHFATETNDIRRYGPNLFSARLPGFVGVSLVLLSTGFFIIRNQQVFRMDFARGPGGKVQDAEGR